MNQQCFGEKEEVLLKVFESFFLFIVEPNEPLILRMLPI